jgi:hypothetical protein
MAADHMSTVEFDSASLARFRDEIKDHVRLNPTDLAYQKEAAKVVHMNDRQLWSALKLHTFLSWIEYRGRENMRRDRMTPVPSVSDDGEEAAAG